MHKSDERFQTCHAQFIREHKTKPPSRQLPYFDRLSLPYGRVERKMGGHKALRAGGGLPKRGGGRCRAERGYGIRRNTSVLEQ
jgi:hypothetical protein